MSRKVHGDRRGAYVVQRNRGVGSVRLYLPTRPRVHDGPTCHDCHFMPQYQGYACTCRKGVATTKGSPACDQFAPWHPYGLPDAEGGEA